MKEGEVIKRVTFERKDESVVVVRSVGGAVVWLGELIVTNGATVGASAFEDIRRQNPDVEFVEA